MSPFFLFFRRESSFLGVKVCIIEPGYFQTAVTNDKILIDNFSRAWERAPEEIKNVYGKGFLQKSECHSLVSYSWDAMGGE